MPFTVLRRVDLSLADLCRLDREGASVTKTPHPGNIYLNNLAVAQLGLRLLFHDRTLGERDRNFHPHKVIKGGRSEVIADPNVLMTHARVLQPSRLMNSHFQVGKRVAQCHLNVLAEAVSGVRMRLYTDYLVEHEDIVHEVLSACASVALPMGQGWKRYVDEEGRVHDRGLVPWCAVVAGGIYGLHGKTAGWIMPNIFNILTDGVIEALLFGASDIYHLSGPDMINYITQLAPSLSELYDCLRGCVSGLPEELRFHVVPVASMRLVTTADRRDMLDRIVALYLHIKEESVRAGDAIEAASPKDVRHALIEGWKVRRKDLRRDLREALCACPEIFYDITRGDFVSQHDAIERGGVYVHPWGVNTPISAVTSAMQELYSLFEP